jgi:hypothetical protein
MWLRTKILVMVEENYTVDVGIEESVYAIDVEPPGPPCRNMTSAGLMSTSS